jgi:hypothetical protein
MDVQKSAEAGAEEALVPHVWTVEDIKRLLAERELPTPRGGPLTWAWILAVPFLWWAVILAPSSGPEGAEWFFAIAFTLMTARLIARLARENSHRRTALLLPELDAEWVGALVEAQAFGGPTLRSIARQRLVTVLPSIKPVKMGCLTDAQRALLFDQLTHINALTQPDFIVAIIRFAANLGDDLAIEGMYRLARLPGLTHSLRTVRREARSALPDLESAAAKRISMLGEEAFARHRDDAPYARNLSPEAQALLDNAEEERKKQPAMRFVFLLAVWGIVFPFGVFQVFDQIGQGNWHWAALFAAGSALISQAHKLALTPRQTMTASRLASVDDVQAVGPLAEMTTWPDDRIKSMAMAALTRLLPRMKSTDTQLLSTTQRALLYQSLRLSNARRNAEFLEALLHALEQVGDTEAIPYVRALAESQPTSMRQRRVVESARECLPFLEGCAQQNRNSQVLLLAATSDVEESLLRPAASTPLMSAELLVRAAKAADD